MREIGQSKRTRAILMWSLTYQGTERGQTAQHKTMQVLNICLQNQRPEQRKN